MMYAPTLRQSAQLHRYSAAAGFVVFVLGVLTRAELVDDGVTANLVCGVSGDDVVAGVRPAREGDV
jgi:uncharacterized membrane protein (DUF4010 family)